MQKRARSFFAPSPFPVSYLSLFLLISFILADGVTPSDLARRSKSRAARRNLRCRRYHSACHQSFRPAKSFVNGCIRCLAEQQDGCQRQIDDAGLWLQVLQSAVLRNESYSFFYARKIPPLLRTMGFCSVKQCVCLS